MISALIILHLMTIWSIHSLDNELMVLELGSIVGVSILTERNLFWFIYTPILNWIFIGYLLSNIRKAKQ